MNTDAKLRQCFLELRSTDTQHTPAFSRVARAPRPAVTLPWLRLAAGAAVLVTLIVALAVRRHPVADPQQWAALSNWRATTDGLLTVTNSPLGSTISTPTDLWIENSTQTNQKEML